MILQLSLPENKEIWALSNPEEARSYISYNKEKGVQETILIFTSKDRGPKEVNLEEYPAWAKRMILSSIIIGELVNTGDPIRQTSLSEVSLIKEEEKEQVTVVKKKVTKKKVIKKKTKKA